MNTTSIDQKTLGAHVLRALHDAQRRGRSSTLESVSDALGVRKVDVRSVVTSLHREGHVDGQRMRLTLAGFAIAASMRACKLRDLRDARATESRAA